jgi:tetratricopeptide (TPR) repeat protein
LASNDDRLWRARLNRKLGVSTPVGETDTALGYFAAAEASLGLTLEAVPPDWQREWLEVQCDRMNALLWRRRVQEMTDVAEKVRPFVERWGSARQRARFYDQLYSVGLMRDRFVASGATLAYVQAALLAGQESGDQTLVAYLTDRLAMGHLWRGDLDEAERGCQAALKLAESVGYVRGQAIALSHLSAVYRRRGQIDLVKHLLPRALDLQQSADLPASLGTIYGHLAWVAWREGRLADVQSHGAAALESWRRHQSPDAALALLPLLAAALAQGQVGDAIGYARRMFDIALLPLPEALEAPLGQAIAAWDAGQAEAAHAHLSRAVELAPQEGGYL